MKPDLRAQLAAVALGGPADLTQTEIEQGALQREATTFGALAKFAQQGRSQEDMDTVDAPASLLVPLP